VKSVFYERRYGISFRWRVVNEVCRRVREYEHDGDKKERVGLGRGEISNIFG
jgi:hypothetical protein